MTFEISITGEVDQAPTYLGLIINDTTKVVKRVMPMPELQAEIKIQKLLRQ